MTDEQKHALTKALIIAALACAATIALFLLFRPAVDEQQDPPATGEPHGPTLVKDPKEKKEDPPPVPPPPPPAEDHPVPAAAGNEDA